MLKRMKSTRFVPAVVIAAFVTVVGGLALAAAANVSTTPSRAPVVNRTEAGDDNGGDRPPGVSDDRPDEHQHDQRCTRSDLAFHRRSPGGGSRGGR